MIDGTGKAISLLDGVKKDSLLGEIYKDVAQPSLQKIGSALSDVLEFCTTPLLLFKFGSEVAKLNYRKHLDNYIKKLDQIPEEELINVNPQIGIPLLDKLTYTTNEEIAELFICLLTKASSSKTVNEAHPAFIQIIDRLSVDEAKLMKYLEGKTDIPFVDFRLVTMNKGHFVLLNYGTMMQFETLDFAANISIYIANMIGLGVLAVKINEHLVDDSIYESLKEKLHYQQYVVAIKNKPDIEEVEVKKGILQVTPFGKAFIKACAL